MKLSICVTPPIQHAIDLITSPDKQDDVNCSGRITGICDRYLRMVADQLNNLNLTDREWCAICDANNGGNIHDDIMPGLPTMIWANIADTPGLGEKWGVDQHELICKIRDAGTSGQCAIMEVVDRFWWRWIGVDTQEALDGALGRNRGDTF
jgi:hypothetical protein